MAEVPQVVPANSEQAAWLRKNANELEMAAGSAMAGVVGRRLAWWQSLIGVAGSYDLNLVQVLGENVVGRNSAADLSAKALVRIMSELYLGRAELVGVEQNERVHLGVVQKGSVQRPVEALPLLPLVIVGGFAGVSFLTFSIWAFLEKTKTDARLAEEANEARKMELLKVAQGQGPSAVAQMADILRKIDEAAAKKQASLLDQIKAGSQAITDVTDTVKTSVGAGLAIVIVLALLSMSRSFRA
jgi:hypothetical protein